MGRILALDFGVRQVGLALSDETQRIAQGLQTFKYTSEKELIARIEKIVKECQVSEIVIGNPISLSGQKTRSSQKVANFQAKLAKCINIPIKLFDERLTSQLAIRILATVYQKPLRKKAATHKLSATIILEDYLAKKDQKRME